MSRQPTTFGEISEKCFQNSVSPLVFVTENVLRMVLAKQDLGQESASLSLGPKRQC